MHNKYCKLYFKAIITFKFAKNENYLPPAARRSEIVAILFSVEYCKYSINVSFELK